MTTRISTNNLDGTITAQFSPKISGIAIADNAYTVLDDTAVNVAGGFVVISGSNFVSGCSVLIGSVVATSVSFVNSTTIRAQVPAQAAGSYTVYVTNPDGGLAIRVNGLNYSATPTWSTTSPLPGGQINAAISIQLSAASNSSVTYALQAGSSLPSGVTLSSSGLLSGAVTGISADTTYNFTIVATDTELQDTPQAFSITITASDANFRNTSLLLSANTPGTTFVTDASTNAFNLSVFGDTRPNTFGPYTPGYYSVQLSGSNYLNTASSNEFIASGNGFTVEAWVYYTSITNFSFIVASTTGANNYNPYWFIGSTSTGNWRISWGNATSVDTGVAIGLNSWNHAALVMTSAGAGTFYVNGRSIATTTGIALDGSATGVAIGHGGGSIGGSYQVTGYISNVRYVKNSSVYTAAFTPGTVPLTAITGTSLLTCQANRFVDTSTNALAITATSSPQISSFVPFVPAAGTANLGSGYFDGTGDYLTVSDPNLALGSGDFTLECWINAPAGLTDKSIFEGRTNGNGTTGFTLTAITATSIRIWSGSALITSGSINYVNTWCHVAVARVSGTTTLYINGVSQGTTTSLGNLTDSSYVIGAGKYGSPPSVDAFFTGYISNFRIVKGTAVYTTNFTPPAAPLTAVANTSLLTLQTNQPHNNNQFVDRSTNNFLITRNGNTTPGSFSPYAGGWSNYFDGSGDSLTVPSNAAFSFGTGDFTVEFWAYYPAVSNSNGKMVVDSRPASTNGSFWLFGVTNVGLMSFTTMTTGGITLTDSTARPNQWVHYAATRSGTSLRLFANGTQVASATNSDNISSSGLFIGTNAFSSTATDTFWLGYISNLRIVKGTAVYTSAFTPPTQPLAPITNTSLLTCADNRFVDDSLNNFAITRNGDVSVQKFSPFSMQTQIVPNSHSVFFDGTGDFLDAGTNAALGFGTGDFTVEAWIYRSASGTFPIYTNGPASAGSWAVYVLSDKLQTDYYGGTSLAGATNISLNTWNHVAVIRSGSTLSLYLNGSRDATTTTSSNNSTSNGVVGRDWTNASGYSNGYISNLRVVKGTAVYSGTTYTVPTQPLTSIANTSLLTCQSATIRDNSTNAFAITANGDVRPSQFNPFGYTNPSAATYTTAALGGSMYFDGTGDYLSFPASSAMAMGTGDYTIEFWIYLVGTGDFTVIDNQGSGGNMQISRISGVLYHGSATTWSYTFTNNTWTHIAFSRQGTSLRLFANGILQQTQTNSNSIGSAANTNTIGIRNDNFYPLNGYLSDLRVVKGQAVYTSAFVPPAAPLDPVRNTTLLMRGTSAGVHDSTMNNNLETIGDSRINTSITRFAGRSSIFFDGTGDYIRSVPIGMNAFGTGNFTIETWVYPQSATGYQCMIQIGSTNPYIFLGINTGSTGTPFMWNDGNVIVGSQNFTLNTWQHWAIVRNNGTVTMYLNGTSIGSASYTGNLVDNTGVYLGSNSAGGQTYVGYMSDVRITRGIARYTANFTAPTSPFIQY